MLTNKSNEGHGDRLYVLTEREKEIESILKEKYAEYQKEKPSARRLRSWTLFSRDLILELQRIRECRDTHERLALSSTTGRGILVTSDNVKRVIEEFKKRMDEGGGSSVCAR